MSDRSLFPDSVEVHSRHLRNESSIRSEADVRLALDLGQTGAMSGLAVTVNGGATTKIDIAAGAGYAPNGEFMELAAGQTALTLASDTLGAKNYVLVMYDEVQSSPEAHETDGTTRMTKATVTPRVVVLTESAYNALPASDAILSNNAKDRALLAAIVTANGPAVALTGGSIQSPTSYDNVLQATQPTNITGVKVAEIDPNTTLGTGTLAYVAGTFTITWQAPGDGSPGAGVVLSSSGAYVVTSSGGRTITLVVTYSLLPTTNKSDSIVISNLYSQTIKRFSAEDWQHRTMVGSGNPTLLNPHGMTVDDLSPGVAGSLEEHQDLQHANGIVVGSSPNFLSGAVNTAAAPDTLQITNFSAGDTLYINGKKLGALTGSSTITFNDGVANAGTYNIYLGQDGSLYKSLRATFPNPGSLLSDKIQILNIVGVAPGSYNLTVQNTGTIGFAGFGQSAKVPTVDHFVRLYDTTPNRYIDLYVKGSSTPGATQTDLITVSAEPSLEENLRVCSVPWSGSATGFVGYGWGVASSPNYVHDLRVYGTLEVDHVRSDSGLSDVVGLSADVLQDGFLVIPRYTPGSTNDQFVFSDAYTAQHNLFYFGGMFPNVYYTGGVVYIGGQRRNVPLTTLTLTDNATNRIYINSAGTPIITTSSWESIAASQRGAPFLRWGEIIASGGAFGAQTSLKTYIGLKKDTENGVVGLNSNKAASIASTLAGDISLSVSGPPGPGTGIAISAVASGSSVPLNIDSSGSGNAIFAQQTGTGVCAELYSQNAVGVVVGNSGTTTTKQALRAVNFTNGPALSVSGGTLTGTVPVAKFTTTQASASQPTVLVEGGDGQGLSATNSNATAAAITAENTGNGPSLFVKKTSLSGNPLSVQGPSSAASGSSVIKVDQNGQNTDGIVIHGGTGGTGNNYGVYSLTGDIVVADGFNHSYDTTQIRHLHISPPSFQQFGTNNGSNTIYGNTPLLAMASYTTGGTVTWGAQVHGLPIGATITGFQMLYAHVSQNYTQTSSLEYGAYAASTYNSGVVSTLTVSGTPLATTTGTWATGGAPTNNVVTDDRVYWIICNMPTTSNNFDFKIYGYRITYTFVNLTAGTV